MIDKPGGFRVFCSNEDHFFQTKNILFTNYSKLIIPSFRKPIECFN
jgi:hypothetical protein